MDLRNILIESFRLLKGRPKVFIPRMVTTAIYSIFILYLMWLASDMALLMPALGGMNSLPERDAQTLLKYVNTAATLVVFMPFLYFIDLFSYAMYPRLVADYKADRPVSLSAAFKDGLKAWKVVVVLGFVVFAFVLVVTSVIFISLVLTQITGNPAFIAFSALSALALLSFFAILVFFVVPAAVLGGKGIVDSFNESLRLGVEHRWDLLKINIMFLALILATFAMAYAAKADPVISAASIGVFFSLRLVEAVVYTYLSVTNPVAYLHVRGNNGVKNPE